MDELPASTRRGSRPYACAVRPRGDVSIYTTCPVAPIGPHDLAESIRRTAQWTEAAGGVGALVYTDNGLADPWLVAQIAVEATTSFTPLVALQPAYEHPFTTARAVASFHQLHDRAVHLNLVAGGFVRDLEAIGANLHHDQRYQRLIEHAQITSSLLAGDSVTTDGAHYRVTGLRLDVGDLAADTIELFVSGSSPAGIAAAEAIGALPVRYPAPPGSDDDLGLVGRATGIRLGIIARDTADAAWQLANERFPPDRAGEMKHALAMKVSDSHWHRRESEINSGGTFWMHPVQTYRSFCPYLVGSHREVAHIIGGYLAEGVTTIIVDIPTGPDDIDHAVQAIELAAADHPRAEQ